MHLIALVTILSLLAVAGCVSRSPAANSVTQTLGDWSPVGSQQISRQRQFVLPSHYRLYVGQLQGGPSSSDFPDLNEAASAELARYLRRYFVEVELAEDGQNLAGALKDAAAADADVLLLPRMESWPSIEPVSKNTCPQASPDASRPESCPDTAEKSEENRHGELALSVALYDVRAQQQVDVISAQGRRGAIAFVNQKRQEELQSLCNAIASQLAALGRTE